MKKVTVKPRNCGAQKKPFCVRQLFPHLMYLYRKLLGFFAFFIPLTVLMLMATGHDLTGTTCY